MPPLQYWTPSVSRANRPPLSCRASLQNRFSPFSVQEQVSSVDASDYERATHIHDFNQPLPASLANRFSVVHDGGTIEHVFNIPQAFKNCMEMVRVGGHFIQVNVANNYMGHGFWQFCPELIYRIFSRENGFQIKAVLMHETCDRGIIRYMVQS